MGVINPGGGALQLATAQLQVAANDSLGVGGGDIRQFASQNGESPGVVGIPAFGGPPPLFASWGRVILSPITYAAGNVAFVQASIVDVAPAPSDSIDVHLDIFVYNAAETEAGSWTLAAVPGIPIGTTSWVPDWATIGTNLVTGADLSITHDATFLYVNSAAGGIYAVECQLVVAAT